MFSFIEARERPRLDTRSPAARALRPRVCARVPGKQATPVGRASGPQVGLSGPKAVPGLARALTLLSCWWMSCFSSEAFSGGSDMLGPAPHRASPRFGRSPASPGVPVAAEQSRRDCRPRAAPGGRDAASGRAGREPRRWRRRRRRRRSTVAFKRRGLPGLGLPPALPDHLHLPLPTLGVATPRPQRPPSPCPARAPAGATGPHLFPTRGPFPHCGPAGSWTDPSGPHAERLDGPRPRR